MKFILLLLVCIGSTRGSAQRPVAADLWRAGLEQDAEFRTDSARRLFKAAAERQNDFLPAHLDYMQLMVRLGQHIELRREYDAKSRSAIGDCLSVLAWGLSSHDVPSVRTKYVELIARHGRTPCSELAHTLSQDDSISIDPDLIRRAILQHGNSPALAMAYATALFAQQRSKEAIAFLRAAIDSAAGLNRMRYRNALAIRFSAAGNRSAMLNEVQKMEAQARSDGQPHLRWLAAESKRTVVESQREHVSFFPLYSGFNAELIALATKHGIKGYAFEAMLRDAAENVDRGDYVRAVQRLNAAVAVAEAAGSEDFKLRGYLYRGRAFVAQGKSAAAISDLLRAVENGRKLRERYRVAEALQFLGRAYVVQGDWRSAVATADSLAAYAPRVRDRSKRMILFYEAGQINERAGFHEKSRRYFEEMVRAIDRDRGNYEYAGEYLERTGDYSRALRYYRAAYETPLSGSAKLALAGLVRVYSALGFADSAMKMAGLHDALPLNPQYEILLPRLLVRRGRADEAVRLATKWLDLQRSRGNPTATAKAHTLLAELNLTNHPDISLMHGTAAAREAGLVNARLELVEAMRFRALAEMRLGRVTIAARRLERAWQMSQRLGDVILPVTLLSDLGDVTASNPRVALTWYSRANAHLLRISSGLDDPVIAARFRDARRALFDSAVNVSLRLADEDAARSIAEWSDRKKAATGGLNRLAYGSSILPVVDYVTAGDSIVAVVHVNGTIRLLRLSLSAKRAGDLATQLLRPFATVSGGNLDISRARYPMPAAQLLYDALVRPLEPLLGEAGSFVIVPDVPLQRIPFDALVRTLPQGAEADYSRAEYVADKWEISYSPDAATALGNSRPRMTGGSAMTFIAGDAPGVAAEQTAVLQAWRGRGVTLLSGSRATETRVRTVFDSPILHFATHAISDDADPLRSHMVLQRDERNDGLLHAAEIPRSISGVRLVFLSACETAGGPMFSGTGSLSLARFFLQAGAKSVIATQWPIAADGSRIAADFYRNVAAGLAPRTALHRAKMNLRHAPATANPFFWASHIFVGN